MTFRVGHGPLRRGSPSLPFVGAVCDDEAATFLNAVLKLGFAVCVPSCPARERGADKGRRKTLTQTHSCAMPGGVIR